VIINNAGWDRFGWFMESSEEHWARVIAVNYVGILNTCRYLGGEVIKFGKAGRIIQIASDTAKIGGPLEAVYSGAKGAVVSFSRALARELAPTGVTVNVICPGSTDTPLFRESAARIEVTPEFKEHFPGNLIEAQIKRIPLGRLGLPSDLANAVAFFADPRSEHITGQVLSVDGGETMY
jgi:2-hydroxycyclohexanecarboxyl-CoA dehydrogenase